MLLNKRGAALLQVLIVTAILAGMSALILRLSLARTITSRQTRHVVNAQTVIESCMAEVNAIWAAKTPEAYARDLAACRMCEPTEGVTGCETHKCVVSITSDSNDVNDPDVYTVWADIAEAEAEEGSGLPCKITYTISNTADNARQSL